jgi:TPP-dependent pyruvate/acetoin dehydrogenase alpha subunit
MSTVHAITPHEIEEASAQADLARKCLYHMTMMREIEDRIERKLYRQGKVLGGVYVGRGQEAIPVGSAILSNPEDIILPCHRDMATLLIRGVTPRQIFAQYMGRMGGLTRGRDGNMHMGDLKLNIISIISALAATVPVATGCALGLRYLGKPGVCFTYFGDGATSRGDWHEGVNFATVQKLPIVYVCNNNQYAYSTPLNMQMACANIADKGAAYGMPAEIVDGNDVFAVYDATERALAHCKAGLGPYLLECKTFRMTGHSAHDGAHYVPKELFEDWAKQDPIIRLEKKMIENGWADRAELDAIRAGVLQEIDDAVAWAEQSPYPDPATLLDGVYEDQ